MPLDLDIFKAKVTESRDLLHTMARPCRQEAYNFWQEVTKQLTAFMLQDNPSFPDGIRHDERKSPRSSHRRKREQAISDGSLDLTPSTVSETIVSDQNKHDIGVALPVADSTVDAKLQENTGKISQIDVVSSQVDKSGQPQTTQLHKIPPTKVRKSARISIRKKLSKPGEEEGSSSIRKRQSKAIKCRESIEKYPDVVLDNEKESSGYCVSVEKVKAQHIHRTADDGVPGDEDIKSSLASHHDHSDGKVPKNRFVKTDCKDGQSKSAKVSHAHKEKLKTHDLQDDVGDLQDSEAGDLQDDAANDLLDDTIDDTRDEVAQSLPDMTVDVKVEGDEVEEDKETEGGQEDDSPDEDQTDLPLETQKQKTSAHQVCWSRLNLDPECSQKVQAGYKCTRQRRSLTHKKTRGHWRMHSGEKSFTCGVCSKSFKSQASCDRHTKTHCDVLPQLCPRCGMICGDLEAHLIKKHSVKQRKTTEKKTPYPCDQCDKVLMSRANKKVHVRLCHKGERKYECTDCSKAFQTRSNLKRHLASHKGIKPWKCDTCSAMFGEKGTLERHKRTHTGERPFKCESCEKSFATLWSLSQHVRVHTGVKGFLCDLCGQSFNNRSNLLSHHKTHFNIRPHGCTLCSRKFYTKSDLERHMRSHTGEKPYLCQVCSKTFSRSEYLREHLDNHAGLTPHQCETCGKGFCDRSNFHKHIKRCARNQMLDSVKTVEDQLPQVLSPVTSLLEPPPPPLSPPPAPPDETANYSQVFGHVIHVRLDGLTNGVTDEISEDQVCALIGQEQVADPVVAEAHYALIDDGCMETVQSSFGEVQTVQLVPEVGISSEDLDEEVTLNQWCSGYDQHITVTSEPVDMEILPQEP